MKQTNLEQIRRHILDFIEQNGLSRHRKKLFQLLDKLNKNTPQKISGAQKPELLAGAILSHYVTDARLNVSPKAIAEFYGLKNASLSAKTGQLKYAFLNPQERKARLRHEGFVTAPAVGPFELYAECFEDTDRLIYDVYYDTLESLEQMDMEEQLEALQKLVKRDAYFLDPYIILAEIYEEIGSDYLNARMLEKAYEKAVEMICFEGRYPASLPWLVIENRHIIRAMFNYGLLLWIDGQKEDALKIFKYLLQSNPDDNIGARYAALGILEGLPSYAELEARFMTRDGFLDGSKMDAWYEKHHGKHAGK